MAESQKNRELSALRPKKKTTFAKGETETNAAAFLPNGRNLILARGNGAIESWKLPSGDLDLANSDSQIEAKLVVPTIDGTTLFTQQCDSSLRRLDAKTLKELNRIETPKSISSVEHIAVSPDGSLCAISGYGHVAIVKSDTGEVIHEEPHHHHGQFTPDGQRLVTAMESERGGKESTLRIRNVADWSLVVETNSVRRVFSLAITPNGRWLFVVAPSGLLKAELPE